jgi:hypothetical protein
METQNKSVLTKESFVLRDCRGDVVGRISIASDDENGLVWGVKLFNCDGLAFTKESLSRWQAQLKQVEDCISE